MKFCGLFKKKDPCQLELQIADSRRNLEEAEAQINKLKATLDGETNWFLVVESQEARERERKLTHAVEEICTGTI